MRVVSAVPGEIDHTLDTVLDIVRLAADPSREYIPQRQFQVRVPNFNYLGERSLVATIGGYRRPVSVVTDFPYVGRYPAKRHMVTGLLGSIDPDIDVEHIEGLESDQERARALQRWIPLGGFACLQALTSTFEIEGAFYYEDPEDREGQYTVINCAFAILDRHAELTSFQGSDGRHYFERLSEITPPDQ